MNRLSRIVRAITAAGVLALYLALPLTAMAADPAPGAKTCKATSLIKLDNKPFNVVELSDTFCGKVTQGPASIIITGLNVLALAMIALLSVRMMFIFAKALMDFNNDTALKDESPDKKNGGGQRIVQAALFKALETGLLAVIGYIVITRGANFILDLALNISDGFCTDAAGCDSEKYLEKYFGRFTGVIVKIQNAFAYGIIIIGLVLIGNRWRVALNSQEYKLTDTSATAKVQVAMKETAMIIIVILAAFWSVQEGPRVFNDTIQGFGEEVDQ